jgi:hypothetical protein
MARTTKRRRKTLHARKRQADLRGALLLAGVFLVTGSLVGWYLYRRATTVGFDPATGCPETGPTALTVVVLDLSDAFSVPQVTALRNQLDSLRDTLELHERLDVYTIGETSQELRLPAVSVCNPGFGNYASPWLSNPQLLAKHWRARFAAPLDEAFDRIKPGGGAEKYSPIMETIQSVALTAFQRIPSVSRRRLVLASDMIQNTPDFSQYRSRGVSFAEFQRMPYFNRVRCDLRDTDVTILYLNRAAAPAIQGKDHITFWRDYLAAMNARLASVVRLAG